jgi:tetratricopeptide (TPR) repeat protein
LSPRENKEELIKLGTRYGLVTDYTSLIVLENVMDYVTYKITPPEELLEEYNKILAEIENNKGQTENADSLNFLIPVPLNTEAIENEIISRFGSADSNVQRAFSVAEYDMEEELEEVIEVEDMEVLDMDRREEGLPLKFKKYSGSLILKERVTNTKYLEIIRSAKNMEAAYDLYLQLRKEYQDSPAFYKDVSSHFLKEFADRNYSFRILSNIAEMDFDNYELLKVFAYQLQSIDKHELASFIFQRILELRPEDSQSYRDLALSYENIGKYQDALELLNSIITGEIYDGNHRRVFEGVELIAKNEIKSLINKHKSSLDLSQIDKSLLENEAFNIRVIVDWNHNDTDIDLHIIDPNLEECFYSHPKTKIGGELSPDMTQGFGPEEFILRKAVKGNYYIKVKYYADRYQKEENPTFMKVTIFKNYGLKTETKETKIVRLTKKDDEEIIAKIEI